MVEMMTRRLAARSMAAYTVAAFPAQPGWREERGRVRSHSLILEEALPRCVFF
jgi:hypothetical protein